MHKRTRVHLYTPPDTTRKTPNPPHAILLNGPDDRYKTSHQLVPANYHTRGHY